MPVDLCFSLPVRQVDGETRVGVFAARSIKIGEPLTYDYRFVQFGPEVKCHCAASNCQGYLGTKRKVGKNDICWGTKRRRTPSISRLLSNHQITISTTNLFLQG
ncbi:Histone-lysine N-methyltransferase ashr3, variant 2 [Sarracenia purpurea var. burkii]